MALALDQLQTYIERSQRLVANARRFEAGVSQIEGFSTFASPEEASRVCWRIPVKVDTERLGSPSVVLERLQDRSCPVESRNGLLIPEHNALTGFYGVNHDREFAVARRLQAETLLVHAFALYKKQAVEQTPAQFYSAGR